MITTHLARIIIRWWNAGLTIDEIQDLAPFATHDDIARLIATHETRKHTHHPQPNQPKENQ
ncbi:hypothetical protein EP30_01155 [Bifidobacterium sp. UTCIF-39]|uniref:hypothetical protein n=1 Tax=Bifidobacterium sp. UTCIF-39 TaxID=1465359 RepID=UPI00112637F7|nr:hypothetical protein [Bifidobacterium sp. UTCIF-39]TPF97579.1 hypothetical protein EP30_01155 [Bifidobacterium sp. UTCIF-39]